MKTTVKCKSCGHEFPFDTDKATVGGIGILESIQEPEREPETHFVVTCPSCGTKGTVPIKLPKKRP